MSHFLDPLHAPVPKEFHSQYTALSRANSPLEPPFQTSIPPNYKRVPQAPLSQLSMFRRRRPQLPIMFELIGTPSYCLGIPMRELVVRSACALEQMLVDASEPVGSLMSGSLGILEVSLRITWPGYEHVDWIHSLKLFSAASPVTRSELAVQIAFAFSAFVAQMASQTPSPHAASWRLGSSSTGGITFERLWLIALWNACDDQWMAEVFIDAR